uniref:Uncharacterized protein n=1 Tax=Arundo donax TaxID=35708 RepID=A0A0A9E0X0_ARUDO
MRRSTNPTDPDGHLASAPDPRRDQAPGRPTRGAPRPPPRQPGRPAPGLPAVRYAPVPLRGHLRLAPFPAFPSTSAPPPPPPPRPPPRRPTPRGRRLLPPPRPLPSRRLPPRSLCRHDGPARQAPTFPAGAPPA